MLTPNARKIFEMKYSKDKKETWEQACLRVADHVAGAEKEEERNSWTAQFYKIIHELCFLPGGRILANAGTGIHNLLNCFVLPIGDSRQSIYETLKNAAEVFAHGGGIGYNFSDLREEGAEITSTGGQASGPISFMSLFDQTGEVIQQASRRGAQIGVMDVDHPDIEKYIHYKSTPNNRNQRLLEEYKRNLRWNKLNDTGKKYFHILEKTLQDDQLSHFNISVMVSDTFMLEVSEDGDWSLISRKSGEPISTIRAKDLVHKIASQAWESGDPGVLFYDRTNEDNMVKYLGDIRSTNPCVVGDTEILTVYDGPQKIRELAKREEPVLVYTWNPETKLPEVSEMVNIRKTRENSELVEVEFDSGLKLRCTPDHHIYTFRGEKVEARDLIPGQSVRAYSMSVHPDGHLRVHGWVDGKTKHKYVARMIWEYFYGPVPDEMIIHHRDFDKLNNHVSNFELLTNSEHNSVHYPYRADGGFRRGNHKVVSVKFLEEKEDVYNGTVLNTHCYIISDPNPVSGCASGVVSANCGEIGLLPYEACCLGSINLAKFVDGKSRKIDWDNLEYTVRTAIRFLDDVQEVTELPIDEINYWCKGLRRLGLGIFGWADMLAMLEIPYGSKESLDLANYLSWFISFFSWLESINLATERGPFPLYDSEEVDLSVVEKILNSQYNPEQLNMDEVRKIGVRNVSVTSIAPTGTIALLAGANSGIEPFFALAYRRNITEGIGNTARDFLIEINPVLFEKLSEYNLNEEELSALKQWLLDGKSLKDFECRKIPEKLKAAFTTSHEISPHEHVDMQAAFQQFVTNSISKTINLPEDASVEDIEEIISYGWNKNLKGLTVYRDKSKTFQILNVGGK